MEFDLEYPQQHNIHHAISKKKTFKNNELEILTFAPGINRVFKSIGFPT
jgi:hypothetical protein